MEQTQSRRARFGPFELDLRAGELHGNGAPVLLPIQVLQVLQTLIERDGDLVSREELKKCLWPNDTTSYFDANLLLAQVSASAAGGEIVAVQNKETDRIELMTLDADVASDLKEVLSVQTRWLVSVGLRKAKFSMHDAIGWCWSTATDRKKTSSPRILRCRWHGRMCVVTANTLCSSGDSTTVRFPRPSQGLTLTDPTLRN